MDQLSSHIKKLRPVKAGDSIKSVLTAERVNALQDAILSLAKGENVVTSGGLLKKSFTSSFSIRAQDGDESILGGPPCELAMSDASNADYKRVTFSWGRIAGRQPTGFNTRGMITPLAVANDGAFHYFFAKCTFSTSTLLWTAAEITEEVSGIANTATVAYVLLGAAQVVSGVLQLSPPVCGPIFPDPCSLAQTY